MADLLASTLEQTRDDLRRADASATTLILTIAGLAALVGQIGKDLPHHVLIAVSVAALPAAATVVLAAFVIAPRGRRPRGTISPGSWIHACHAASWKTLLESYEEADPAEVNARQLRAVALIVEIKFTWLARATNLLITTVAVLAAAFVYGAVSALI